MHIGHRSKVLLLCILALTITGCARTLKYDTPEFKAPFYITVTPDGEVVVLDSEGKKLEVEATVAEIPNRSVIKQVTNFSALEVHGSHYYLLYINGRYVKIPLPH